MNCHFIKFGVAWLCLSIPTRAAELSVRPANYWKVKLFCERVSLPSEGLTARTTITQPQGFSQVLDAIVHVKDGRAEWTLDYPLIDEGRLEAQPGNWNGYWTMGEYRFHTEFYVGSDLVHTVETTLDPTALCPRDRKGPIFTEYPQQFIECAPLRPAYIDVDGIAFTIRTFPHRVAKCIVEVDVTDPGGKHRLAGPWTIALTGEAHRQDFNSSGWPRGEYWIRVRVQKEGKPVGPFLIRKFWKELLPVVTSQEQPQILSREMPNLAGPFGFEACENIQFYPGKLEKKPNHPLVTMDKPWETELLYFKTVHFDTDRREFVLDYELAQGSPQREEQRLALSSTICRAVSQNGLSWHKPPVGVIQFNGSIDNNLVPPGQEYVPARPANLPPSLSHDINKAKFRQFNSELDGPVNMQNVFVTAVKRSFVNNCSDPSSKPFRYGSWPMEKRGNEYLVLTSEPILYVGTGMDLYHSTEKICLHLEDKSTGTLYYFFRPGAPPYPPHDCPYDNMHMARRCLAVMWTRDGLHWQRRLVLVPDEYDVPGTQFYFNTALVDSRTIVSARPAMALEHHWHRAAIEGGFGFLGTLAVFDSKANRIWPELVYATDPLHWYRFANRQKLIENGPAWNYDYGLIKVESSFHQFGDEWWLPYEAINTLHQDYVGLTMGSIEELKKDFPNYSEVPEFVDWQQYWARCKTMRYYPAIARCVEGRACWAESANGQGLLTTPPLVLKGNSLFLNADVAPSGLMQVEILDAKGQVLAGLERENCLPIQGDSTEHEVNWRINDLSECQGKSIRLRFVLEGARLYSYRVR